MPGETDETTRLSLRDLQVAEGLADLRARSDGLERDRHEHEEKLDRLEDEIARVRGLFEGSVPQLQSYVETTMQKVETQKETNELYYAQIRDMVADLEKLKDRLDELSRKHVDQERVAKLEREYVSREEVAKQVDEARKNVLLYVRLGWLAVGTGLLFLGLKAWVF